MFIFLFRQYYHFKSEKVKTIFLHPSFLSFFTTKNTTITHLLTMEVRVKTSGVCLASLFEQIACADSDFEGLIIGTQPRVTTSTQATDTAAVVERTVCEHSKRHTFCRLT